MSDINKIPLDVQCSCGHDQPAPFVKCLNVSCGRELALCKEEYNFRPHGGTRSVMTTHYYYECPVCWDTLYDEAFRFMTMECVHAGDRNSKEAWVAKYGEPLARNARNEDSTESDDG